MLTDISQMTPQTGTDNSRIWHRRGWCVRQALGGAKCPLLANNGLPGHVAGTSALPLTADIRVPMSVSRFWLQQPSLTSTIREASSHLVAGASKGAIAARVFELPSLGYLVANSLPSSCQGIEALRVQLTDFPGGFRKGSFALLLDQRLSGAFNRFAR